MRKPRDYDAELEALNDKAKQLKERKLRQLGELVVAIGADTLPIEQLAGLLVAGVESKTQRQRRAGANAALRSFKERVGLVAALARTRAALRRTVAARHRLSARIASDDKRDWVMKRR